MLIIVRDTYLFDLTSFSYENISKHDYDSKSTSRIELALKKNSIEFQIFYLRLLAFFDKPFIKLITVMN